MPLFDKSAFVVVVVALNHMLCLRANVLCQFIRLALSCKIKQFGREF
jgi:hypothetical protein